jgi:hypothetical protein
MFATGHHGVYDHRSLTILHGFAHNPSPLLSSFNAFLTMAPHIFAYGFVLTLISRATSSPYLAAAAKSLLANSSNSLLSKFCKEAPVSAAFKYKYARCEYAVRSILPWYEDTGAVADDAGNERCMARDRLAKSGCTAVAEWEKMC